MDTVDVVARVAFLSLITVVGFGFGKRFPIKPQDLSVLLVYLIAPAVVFVSVLQAPEVGRYFYFTAGMFVVCCVLATLALGIGQLLWQDSRRNLFSFSGGTGNTGYFGLPLAYGVLGEQGAAIAAFIIIGANLYEFSFGYYIASRGNTTANDSLRKIVKLPILYAFVTALLLRHFNALTSEVILSGLENFKGAYTVLGMLVIGVTLSKFDRFRIDWLFLTASLSWKFVVWPLFCLLLITNFEHYLTQAEQAVIMMMASVPMAGNIVVIASQLNVQPERAATAVMASTLVALVVVPAWLLILRSLAGVL